MATWIGAVVIDTPEPKKLARFWADALGYEIYVSEEEWAGIADPEREHVRVSFQSEKEPKSGSNRLHFDLFAHDVGAEVERLTALGARKKRVNPDPNDPYVVMEDPEGNEFCVCRVSVGVV